MVTGEDIIYLSRDAPSAFTQGYVCIAASALVTEARKTPNGHQGAEEAHIEKPLMNQKKKRKHCKIRHLGCVEKTLVAF